MLAWMRISSPKPPRAGTTVTRLLKLSPGKHSATWARVVPPVTARMSPSRRMLLRYSPATWAMSRFTDGSESESPGTTMTRWRPKISPRAASRPATSWSFRAISSRRARTTSPSGESKTPSLLASTNPWARRMSKSDRTVRSDRPSSWVRLRRPTGPRVRTALRIV